MGLARELVGPSARECITDVGKQHCIHIIVFGGGQVVARQGNCDGPGADWPTSAYEVRDGDHWLPRVSGAIVEAVRHVGLGGAQLVGILRGPAHELTRKIVEVRAVSPAQLLDSFGCELALPRAPWPLVRLA
jgi:hypothetical protein